MLTLALSIGANTAIFSIINAGMFKSLPIRDPQHLMLLKWSASGKLSVHGFGSYGAATTRPGPTILTAAHYRSPSSPKCARSDPSQAFHLSGAAPKARATADFFPVGPQFFETMRISVQRGPKFKPEEYGLAAKAATDPKVKAQIFVPAIVNEAFIHAYFPKGNPLGRTFGAYTPDPGEDPEGTPTAGWQIVGVVRDIKYESLRRKIGPTIYVPTAGGGRSKCAQPAIRSR